MINFDFGENRWIKLRVLSCDNQDFVIFKAEYEIKKGTEIIEEGVCEVNDKILAIKFNPQSVGIYHLKITYVIQDETFVDLITIKVV